MQYCIPEADMHAIEQSVDHRVVYGQTFGLPSVLVCRAGYATTDAQSAVVWNLSKDVPLAPWAVWELALRRHIPPFRFRV